MHGPALLDNDLHCLRSKQVFGAKIEKRSWGEHANVLGLLARRARYRCTSPTGGLEGVEEREDDVDLLPVGDDVDDLLVTAGAAVEGMM